MRVGLNATCFGLRPSGANQRFRHLLGAAIRRNPDIQFIVYEPRDAAIADWFADCPNVEARITPLPSEGRLARLAAGAGYWQSALRADRLDLFEAFNLPAVIAPDCPTLLTIHDLRPLRADAPALERLVAAPVLRRALGRAACTITVSQAIADEVAAFCPAARTEVIHNGVIAEDSAAPGSAEVSNVLANLALPEIFALAVGHIEPRKNLGQLVEALALLQQRGSAMPLVIVGNDGGAQAALRAQVTRLGLGDLVHIRNGVDDAALRALYAASRLVAFPSRYEGFGIPLLEAMAAGKPLVASDIPPFREVAGDAARLFALGNAQAAADALAGVWHDPAEQARLVAAGQNRLPDFAFDRLADQLAALYRRIAAKP